MILRPLTLNGNVLPGFPSICRTQNTGLAVTGRFHVAQSNFDLILALQDLTHVTGVVALGLAGSEVRGRSVGRRVQH